MRVVIHQKHIGLNKKLADDSNKSASRFSSSSYQKLENIESQLLNRNISVEKKKAFLVVMLHSSIIKAFSINKKKFNKKAYEAFKLRLHNARRIIHKLRSINYYLETVFLRALKTPRRIKIKNGERPRVQKALSKSELDALEYATYHLIGDVVMLDKKLLKGYSKKEILIVRKEKVEANDMELILANESELLEHLEAKLPPPKKMPSTLEREPNFTHWVARIFALLALFEHIYLKESMIFNKLKRNKETKMMIGKKIDSLIREQSKLVSIMQEKLITMKKFRINPGLKMEIHHLTTVANL